MPKRKNDDLFGEEGCSSGGTKMSSKEAEIELFFNTQLPKEADRQANPKLVRQQFFTLSNMQKSSDSEVHQGLGFAGLAAGFKFRDCSLLQQAPCLKSADFDSLVQVPYIKNCSIENVSMKRGGIALPGPTQKDKQTGTSTQSGNNATETLSYERLPHVGFMLPRGVNYSVTVLAKKQYLEWNQAMYENLAYDDGSKDWQYFNRLTHLKWRQACDKVVPIWSQFYKWKATGFTNSFFQEDDSANDGSVKANTADQKESGEYEIYTWSDDPEMRDISYTYADGFLVMINGIDGFNFHWFDEFYLKMLIKYEYRKVKYSRLWVEQLAPIRKAKAQIIKRPYKRFGLNGEDLTAGASLETVSNNYNPEELIVYADKQIEIFPVDVFNVKLTGKNSLSTTVFGSASTFDQNNVIPDLTGLSSGN